MEARGFIITNTKLYETKTNFILFDIPADKADESKLVMVEVKHNELVLRIDAYDVGDVRYQKIQ